MDIEDGYNLQYTYPKTALQIYTHVALTDNCPRAQYYVGLTWAHTGSHECVAWLTAARDQKHDLWSTLAENALGEYYFYHQHDLETASTLFLSTSNQGSLSGLFHLSQCHLQQKKQVAESLNSIRQTANANLREAQYALGLMYAAGTLVNRDYPEALRWTLLAVQNPSTDVTNLGLTWFNHKQAYRNLGYLYGKNRNKTESLVWTRLAASLHCPESQYNLGMAYFFDHDTTQGLKWLILAADQNLACAQFFLGNYYSFCGIHGNFTSTSEAMTWLYKAALTAKQLQKGHSSQITTLHLPHL